MIDKDLVGSLHEILPDITEVKLFPWVDGRPSEDFVTVATAEKRPVEHRDERAFGDIEIEVDRTVFFLWSHSIRWTGAVPEQKIATRWVIEESNGDRWSIVGASLEMMKTRWRCPCVQNFQRP